MAFAPTQSMTGARPMALSHFRPQQQFMAQTQMHQSSWVSTASAALAVRLHASQWTVRIHPQAHQLAHVARIYEVPA